MLFNQTPFRSADIDDGYRPSQSSVTVQHMLATNYRYAGIDLPRRIDPRIGHYFYGPVDSIQQHVVLQRAQNPGLLPSGTL